MPEGNIPATGLALIDIDLTGDFLGHPGQRAGFLVLAGFLAAFLFIRTSARLMRSPRVPWWPGSVETAGGLHIHHLVLGIVAMMVVGFLVFAVQPAGVWYDVLAVLFGVGMGLTLDEFALWLHLEDVYWAREGRQSLDAVVVAATVAGLVLAGAAPFDTGDGSSIAAITALLALNLAFVTAAVFKGKLFSAMVGLFVPLVAQVAAVRLAKPGSRWAERHYLPAGPKLHRAEDRHERLEALRSRLMDALGGAPSR